MRGLRLAALVAFVIMGGEATAQAPAPLSASTNEVSLQLYASGSTHSRADRITIIVPITAQAETALAARAANAASVDSLTRALVAHGIDRSAIILLPTSPMFGFVGNEEFGDQTGAMQPALAAAMARKTARSAIEVKLSDPALVAHVRDALDAQNQAMMTAPLYALQDDGATRRAATADAIAKARQDAESYAASLGMRVGRIVRVSNFGDRPVDVPDPAAFNQLIAGAAEGGADVVTRVQVWADFTLVPR